MLSEKEAQVRPGANAARGNRVHPPGAGPHQALHTPRHLTAVFRRGETCPEAGSKRVIHSDKAGALPLATGFPLETVRVRQATVCVCVCVCMYMYMYMYIYMCIYMCVYMRVYICVCICVIYVY